MNNLAPAIIGEPASRGISFTNMEQFEQAMRVASVLAGSDLVPLQYQRKPANCLLAMDIADRTGSSAMMVMQNLNMIHNKPSWGSAYIIAAMNTTGRFTSLRYEVTDLGELPKEMHDRAARSMPAGMPVPHNLQCVAYAWELNIPPENRTKENRLDSAPVNVAVAIQEGWWNKAGSKWPVMTELMLRYRAATFFGRMYAPEKLMGMQTAEEVGDVYDLPEDDVPPAVPPADDKQPKKRRSRGVSATDTDVQAVPTVQTEATAPAKPASEPAPAEPAPAEPAPATANPAPAADPAPAAEDAPVTYPSANYRCEVVQGSEMKLVDGRTISTISLKGEFIGQAFFEGALIKFPNDGAIIDAVIETRPHKTRKGETILVISEHKVVA